MSERPDWREIAVAARMFVRAFDDPMADATILGSQLRNLRVATAAMSERPHTPPVPTPTGGKRITVQRACNGCGREIGDATETELLAAVHIGEMPDVRDECGCIAAPVPPTAAPEPRSTPRPSTGTPEPSQAASEALADSWDKGYASGFSNAMRRMSDEPQAPTTPNPFRAVLASVDAPALDPVQEFARIAARFAESSAMTYAQAAEVMREAVEAFSLGAPAPDEAAEPWNDQRHIEAVLRVADDLRAAAPAVPAEGDESR